MPLTVVEEIHFSTLSMQVASAAVEDGDWQMAREALSEACMQAMRALHEVDQRLDGAASSKGHGAAGCCFAVPFAGREGTVRRQAFRDT